MMNYGDINLIRRNVLISHFKSGCVIVRIKISFIRQYLLFSVGEWLSREVTISATSFRCLTCIAELLLPGFSL